jgi:hypothetical protein
MDKYLDMASGDYSAEIGKSRLLSPNDNAYSPPYSTTSQA